jgi:Ca2+-binding EF-hand superfamily protein
MRKDFNLFDTFKIFDPTNYGSLGVFDIQDGMKSVGIPISRDESDLLLKRYDINEDF